MSSPTALDGVQLGLRADVRLPARAPAPRAAGPHRRAAAFASLSSSLSGGLGRRGPAYDLADAAQAQVNLRVVRVPGDGRCMFRALAIGLADIKGMTFTSRQEEREADELRLAVADAICRTPGKRAGYPEAVSAIKLEGDLEGYCKRVLYPTFWGGEPELLVLSQMLRQPIKVYMRQPAEGRDGTKFVELVTYGEQYAVSRKTGVPRKPVHLLFNGKDHYDLLL